MGLSEQYIDQIRQMIANARAWRKANAHREVTIRWNFPSNVGIVAPISNAVQLGMVVANDAGMELLKALWSWDDKFEPTISMVRVAIEYPDDDEKQNQGDESGSTDGPTNRCFPSGDQDAG